MRRRDIIKRSAGALAVTSLVSGTTTARGQGELPDENVSETHVHPLNPEWDPQSVPSGDWITHYIGWIDREGGDRAKEDVERWLDAVETPASIDGEPVQNPNQYWEEVQYHDEHDTWGVFWFYSTPPKERGRHTFTIEFRYPDGFSDGDFDFDPGTVKRFRGYYDVEPRSDQKNR